MICHEDARKAKKGLKEVGGRGGGEGGGGGGDGDGGGGG